MPTGLFGAIRKTGSDGIALTFDDGPTYLGTTATLDMLRELGVKATFCVLGKQAAVYPALIQRIVREGHTLCNHSYSHDQALGQKSDAEIRSELQRTNDAIHRAVPGVPISYFRHPGGNFTQRAVDIAAEMGMTSMYWDVDPQDWSRPGTQVIIDRVLSHARAGSIILLHDGGGDRTQTVAACRTIIPALRAQHPLIPMPPRPAP